MALTDRALADLCVASYTPGRDTYPWDAGVWVDQVRAFVRYVDDQTDVVAFTGTDNPEQWIIDAAAIPWFAFSHLSLGVIHAGFWIGMSAAFPQIVRALRPKASLVVTGHSLGAAHGWLFTGLMLEVKAPERVVAFGSPRPAFPKLAQLINGAKISTTSYRNVTPDGRDRVTDLPPAFPPELPWTQPSMPFTDICVQPEAGDRSPFRFHRMRYYAQGAKD